MKDVYIKLEDALRVLRENVKRGNTIRPALYNAIDEMKELPPVDVMPVRHGHWVYGSDVGSIGSHGDLCSVCGGYTEDNSEYCGCCGARMDDELQRKYDDYFKEVNDEGHDRD